MKNGGSNTASSSYPSNSSLSQYVQDYQYAAQLYNNPAAGSAADYYNQTFAAAGGNAAGSRSAYDATKFDYSAYYGNYLSAANQYYGSNAAGYGTAAGYGAASASSALNAAQQPIYHLSTLPPPASLTEGSAQNILDPDLSKPGRHLVI